MNEMEVCSLAFSVNDAGQKAGWPLTSPGMPAG